MVLRFIVGTDDNKSSNKSFVCVSRPNLCSASLTGTYSVIASRVSPKVIAFASNITRF